MQTIKLLIPGEYYDSQIYSGRLYLWCEDGGLLILDWNKLIDRIVGHVGDHLKFATYCGLRKGRYLYGYEWKLLAHDSEMRSMLLSRFAELSDAPIELRQEDINYALVQHKNNPFIFPHADMLVSYNQFFVGGVNGLQKSYDLANTESSQASATKLWDGPSLSIAASNNCLAIASGSDGLFESSILNKSKKNNVTQRSSQPSNFVRWLYPSIFSSSYNGGYLADYAIEKVLDGDKTKSEEKPVTKNERVYRETLMDNQLFTPNKLMNNNNVYSWGVRDKICAASSNAVQIMRFRPETPSKRKSDAHLDSLGHEEYGEKLTSEIVSADSAYFGFIIETDDGLLILSSERESNWLENEPVNWRVFPDSRDYVNHLHVVYEDHLQIHSFTHDYFVDQKKKTLGISYGVKR